MQTQKEEVKEKRSVVLQPRSNPCERLTFAHAVFFSYSDNMIVGIVLSFQ